MTDTVVRRLIERHLDGALSPDEASDLAQRCLADPELRQDLADEARMRALLRRSSDFRFRPGFAGRVLARLGEQDAAEPAPALSLAAALARLFPRVAVPALTAAVLLMLANWRAATAAASVVDALIGLPAQSVDLLILL